MIVGTLPDDALLEIFNFYVDDLEEYDNDIEGWHTLVHVCRRWRNVVFASPRRLDLRLLCTPTTSVKEMREIWPEFPIVVYCNATAEGEDDVIDALELNDRVVGISFWDVPRVERFVAVMQGAGPFRFVFGRICATSTTTHLETHSISGITESTFVCHRPCRSCPLEYSAFWVHFTRGDGHLPLRAV